MQKWERVKNRFDEEIIQYKLSDECIERFGKEECEKGISINGVILTLEWKTLANVQDKLSKNLYSESNKDGFVDSRIYVPNEKRIIKENIKP